MRHSLLLFSLFFSLSFLAQDYSVEDRKAIKCYEVALQSFNYKDHAQTLMKINDAIAREPDFIEAYLLKFETEIETKDLAAAEQSMVKALSIDPDYFPNGHFFYGDLKYRKGDYATAKVAYKKFLTYNRTNPNLQEEAERKLANCNFAIEATANPVPFDPQNLGESVNSEWPEYFPSLTTDDKTLLFTRRLMDARIKKEQEDFYIAQKEDEWLPALPVVDINTVFNEGAPSISPDGQILIFTACEDMTGSFGEGRKGIGSCDLFFSSKQGVHWSPPVNMGANINSSHWETQPSFSSDGKTLYFVRGLKTRSGIRNQDIWMSTLNDFGEWTKAEKLSDDINTPFHESSVLVHPDGQTLYFTSEGHVGMGGQDIFLSRRQADGEWGAPVNLGYPINTFKNENSILVSADGVLAYFASDREGGYGDLDLYSFELSEGYRPMRVTYMEGTVVDRENGTPIGARFELIDLETEEVVVESYSNPGDGTFLVSLPEGRDYALNVEKKGYLFFSENFSLATSSSEEPYKKKIELAPIKTGESVVLKNVFFPSNSYELSPLSKAELNTLVSFLNKNYRLKVEIGGHTDNVGKEVSNKALSLNRAEAVKEYLVKEGIPAERLISKGYGASVPISSNDTEEGKAQNRRTEFKVLSVD